MADGCFGTIPATEQPEKPSREQDGVGNTALCQQLAAEAFLQGILNERRGE